MSNTWLNIRFLFWHLQGLTCGHWRFAFNSYHLRWRTALKPIAIHDFNPARRNLGPVRKRSDCCKIEAKACR